MDEKPSSSKHGAAELSETEPLRAMRDISAMHSLYQYDNRPIQNRVWTGVYLTLLAVSTFWGIAAIVKADPRSGEYSMDFLYNSTTCNIDTFERNNPAHQGEFDDTWVNAFKVSISIWLPISAVVGLTVSVCFVLLFRRYARVMVTISIVVSLVMAYAIAILSLVSGSVGGGVILLVVAILLTVFFWWIRGELVMVAKLLSVAGTGLVENPMVIVSSIAVQLGGIGVLWYLAYTFMCSVDVGHVQQSRLVYRAVQPADGDGDTGMCIDALGMRTPCCEWRTPGWAGLYCFVDLVAILWTAALVMQIKLFICADVMSCWYFQPAGMSEPHERPSVKRALRHCFVSSFGSVTFGAAILAVVETLRTVLRQAARDNIVCCILNCILQPLLAILQQFTKFATVATAITGKDFVQASRDMLAVLQRAELPVYSVWWVPDMVLGLMVFLFSLTWAVIVGFAVALEWDDNPNCGGIAFCVAGVCFLCVWFQTNFVAGILLDVVNTIYVCYAFDRDVKHVTRPDFHIIYQSIPNVGPVIENPDGALAYGAPQQPHPPPPQMYPPPSVQGYPQHPYPAQAGALQPAYLPHQPAYNPHDYPAPPPYSVPPATGGGPMQYSATSPSPYHVPVYNYPAPPGGGPPAPSYQLAASYNHPTPHTPGYAYDSSAH